MAMNDNDIIDSSISIKTNSIHCSVTLSDEAELEFERKMWLALAPYYGVECRVGEFRPRDSLMNNGIQVKKTKKTAECELEGDDKRRKTNDDNILKRDDDDSDVKPAPKKKQSKYCTRHPPSVILHLKKWFYRNKSNPYPATETIEEIALTIFGYNLKSIYEYIYAKNSMLLIFSRNGIAIMDPI
eukprot:scaffold90658_cov116-Cyclotella_meneghiniana.AAC.5